METQRYFAAGAETSSEQERLHLLASVLDPATFRHLSGLGVTNGWSCLEVGAGEGSVVRWLAERVGAAGRVLATDINTTYLEELHLGNVEVRRHDILKDELEAGSYDVAHCRLLLTHLPQPEKAVERMAAALRPGGALLLEEWDYGMSAPLDPDHPSAPFFEKVLHALIDVMARKGGVDMRFGRRVRDLVERLGLVEIGHEGTLQIVRAGDARARLSEMTMQTAVKPLIAAGVFTEEHALRLRELFGDPSFAFFSATTFAAWGRRPR